MRRWAYYNELDSYAAAWLRELIKAGEIADGEVDERSIEDVRPDDLRGFRQCHFFAGIGGWSLGLRYAGWPDDRAVWTGSCPCQPFSAAGKGRGTDDPRHLWPQFRRLIRQRRPAVVFGEQVASAAGRRWLSAVFADLEALAYRAAGADLCGPSVGAFDIRQRLWFVADTSRVGRQRWPHTVRPYIEGQAEWSEGLPDAERGGIDGRLGHTSGSGASRFRQHRWESQAQEGLWVGSSDSGKLGDAGSSRLPNSKLQELSRSQPQHKGRTVEQSGRSFWSDCEWLPCVDGKARPVEPGSFPLASGVPARVGRLRGYGNSIKPQVAAAFIESYLACV